jgi:hypothetical protein
MAAGISNFWWVEGPGRELALPRYIEDCRTTATVRNGT